MRPTISSTPFAISRKSSTSPFRKRQLILIIFSARTQDLRPEDIHDFQKALENLRKTLGPATYPKKEGTLSISTRVFTYC